MINLERLLYGHTLKLRKEKKKWVSCRKSDHNSNIACIKSYNQSSSEEHSNINKICPENKGQIRIKEKTSFQKESVLRQVRVKKGTDQKVMFCKEGIPSIKCPCHRVAV